MSACTLQLREVDELHEVLRHATPRDPAVAVRVLIPKLIPFTVTKFCGEVIASLVDVAESTGASNENPGSPIAVPATAETVTCAYCST
jgi:hypothetical protein